MRAAVREHGLGLLVIAAIAGAVYLNGIGAPFHWDDDWLIRENAGIRDLRNVPTFFAPGYWQKFYTDFFRSFPGRGYRPVAEISFAVDHAIWGLDPRGFHLTNLLVHIANCGLVYFLTYRIFGHRRVAIFGTLLFAVHPLHTEAVVWSKVRSQLLALTFLLVSVLLYARYTAPGRKRAGLALYLGSFAAFGLAILCKATAIITPALIALYIWCFVPRQRWRGALLGLLPFAGAVMALFSINPLNPNLPRTPYPVMMYVAAIVVVLGEYSRLFVAPVGLSLHRAWHTAAGHMYSQLPGAAPFVLAVIGGGILALRRSRKALFGLGWYVIALTPAFRVAFMGRQIAESRMYGPSIGLCMIFGLLLHRLAGLSPTWLPARALPRAAVGLCVLVVGVCSGLTVARNADWGNSFGLWLDTVEKNPASYHAQLAVAKGYFDRGDFEKASEHLENAFETRPQDAQALRQLGDIYEQMGQDDEAMKQYRRLLELDDTNVLARIRLGILYGRRGERRQAVGYLRAAIGIDPTSWDAHYNLGVFYANNREYDEAAAAFLRAVQLAPENAMLREALATTYAAQEQYDKAIVELKQALRYAPGHPQLHQDLASTYMSAGDIDQAIVEYRKCLAVDETDPSAWMGLGACYERLGDADEAARCYERCVALGGPAAATARGRLAELNAAAPQ